jgi:hypothetical protein
MNDAVGVWDGMNDAVGVSEAGSMVLQKICSVVNGDWFAVLRPSR